MPKSTHIHTVRYRIAQKYDLPAFRAAYFVLSFLLAALCNVGVFLLLFAAHIGIDIIRYREMHPTANGRRIAVSIVRENLTDFALLFAGVFIAVVLDPYRVVLGQGSGLHVAGLLTSAAFLLFSKLLIFSHFLRAAIHPESHIQAIRFAYTRKWNLFDGVYTLGIVALIILFVLVSLTLPGQVHTNLLRELRPWLV